MKLSTSNATVPGPVALCIHPVRSISALQDCRLLLQQQPLPIARKLGRLIDRVEKALDRDASDVALRLREFAEAARYISLVRRSHDGSRALYELAALLLGDYAAPLRTVH